MCFRIMRAGIGDLIRLKNSPYHGDLIGMIIDRGIDEMRVYGDGIERQNYVKVKWFNKKYPSVYKFTEGFAQFEVISKAQDNI